MAILPFVGCGVNRGSSAKWFHGEAIIHAATASAALTLTIMLCINPHDVFHYPRIWF
jgi:hypothetical protein